MTPRATGARTYHIARHGLASEILPECLDGGCHGRAWRRGKLHLDGDESVAFLLLPCDTVYIIIFAHPRIEGGYSLQTLSILRKALDLPVLICLCFGNVLSRSGRNTCFPELYVNEIEGA